MRPEFPSKYLVCLLKDWQSKDVAPGSSIGKGKVPLEFHRLQVVQRGIRDAADLKQYLEECSSKIIISSGDHLVGSGPLR